LNPATSQEVLNIGTEQDQIQDPMIISDNKLQML